MFRVFASYIYVHSQSVVHTRQRSVVYIVGAAVRCFCFRAAPNVYLQSPNYIIVYVNNVVLYVNSIYVIVCTHTIKCSLLAATGDRRSCFSTKHFQPSCLPGHQGWILWWTRHRECSQGSRKRKNNNGSLGSEYNFYSYSWESYN